MIHFTNINLMVEFSKVICSRIVCCKAENQGGQIRINLSDTRNKQVTLFCLFLCARFIDYL